MIPYNILHVPLALLVASTVVIVVTTTMTDSNGLSALIGGYSGVVVGLLLTVVIVTTFSPNTHYIELLPLMVLMCVTGLMLYLVSSNFKEISEGHVSPSYVSFSMLSTLFMGLQMGIIFKSMYDHYKNASSNGMLFNQVTFALLGMFGVMHGMVALTVGVILKYYGTQG